MRNVLEVGVHTVWRVVADHVRLAFCPTLAPPLPHHGSPDRDSLHSFPIPTHYHDAVPSRRREPPDSRARKSARANRVWVTVRTFRSPTWLSHLAHGFGALSGSRLRGGLRLRMPRRGLVRTGSGVIPRISATSTTVARREIRWSMRRRLVG
jgi:hypothetical protein